MPLHHGLRPVPGRMPRQLPPAWRSPPLPQHSSVAVFPQTPRLRPHPVPYPRNSLPLVKKGSGKKLHVPWKKNRTDLQSCGHGPFPSGGRPECHPGRPGHPARSVRHRLRRNRPVQSGQRRPFHPPGAGGTIPARAPEPSSPALRQPGKKRGLPLPQHKRRIHYGHEQAGWPGFTARRTFS